MADSMTMGKGWAKIIVNGGDLLKREWGIQESCNVCLVIERMPGF